MKWLLLESATPGDLETIMASFHSDVSDEKFSPTREFLKIAYVKLNSELFGGELPNDLEFIVKSSPRASFVGSATYEFNRRTKYLKPIAVTLNGSRTLTIHEWLEVIVHEMVHVTDYTMNPDHFINGRYDAHGSWFLNYGKRFEKDGFHVQKYCDADMGINVDDDKVKRQLKDLIFIEFRPGCIVRTSSTGKAKVLSYFRQRGFIKFKYYTSENPNAVSLSQFRPRDLMSKLSYYRMDSSKFQEEYGPFKEIKMNSINEDKDEVEYDDMNRIEDDYAKHIYDNVKGVVDVKKKSDDEFIVTIA